MSNSPDKEEEEKEEEPESPSWVKWVFILLIVLQIAANYDSGALAALFGDDDNPKSLQKDFNLSEGEKGLLGSIVYIGLTVGCILSGYLLYVVRARWLLIGSMVLNVGFTIAFSLAPTKGVLFLTRSLVGITQAALAVFCPVWVDEFAPPASKATWMALTMAGVPLGIVVGYLTSGFIVANTSLDWQWGFFIQTFILGPLVLVLCFQPSDRLSIDKTGADEKSEEEEEEARKASKKEKDKKKKEKKKKQEEKVNQDKERAPSDFSLTESDSSSDDKPVRPSLSPPRRSRSSLLMQPSQSRRSLLSSNADNVIEVPYEAEEKGKAVPESMLREVVCNSLTQSATWTLCALYFVVTGLQLWITDYLTDEEVGINADLNTVVTAFGITAISAPIVGVIVGGILLDRIGGYSGNIDNAGFMGFLSGLLACLCSWGSLMLDNLWGVIAYIWFVLFFGAMVLPPLMGLLVASVHPAARPTATAFSATMFNLFGYFLGPLVCGVVASEGGLKWGFRVVMGFSSVACFLAFVSYLLARSKVDKEFEETKITVVTKSGKQEVFVENPHMKAAVPQETQSSKREAEQIGAAIVKNEAFGHLLKQPSFNAAALAQTTAPQGSAIKRKITKTNLVLPHIPSGVATTTTSDCGSMQPGSTLRASMRGGFGSPFRSTRRQSGSRRPSLDLPSVEVTDDLDTTRTFSLRRNPSQLSTLPHVGSPFYKAKPANQ